MRTTIATSCAVSVAVCNDHVGVDYAWPVLGTLIVAAAVVAIVVFARRSRR